MCHRRAHALKKLTFVELLNRNSRARLRRADDLKKRDIARVAGHDDKADNYCAAAEHRQSFITSYRGEIERRLTGSRPPLNRQLKRQETQEVLEATRNRR